MQTHKLGVLEEANQVNFCCFVQSRQSICLESQFGLDIVGNLSDQSGERQLRDQVVSPLLIVPDLVQCDGPRMILGRSLPSLPGDGSSSGLLGGVPGLLASRGGCLKDDNEHLH